MTPARVGSFRVDILLYHDANSSDPVTVACVIRHDPALDYSAAIEAAISTGDLKAEDYPEVLGESEFTMVRDISVLEVTRS